MAKLRMLVDGFSTTGIGFGVISADTRRAFPARQWVTGQVPQRPDRVLMASDPEYEPRVLEVTGHLGTTGGSTDFVAKRDELAARLDRKVAVEISFSDSTGQVFFARLRGIEHEKIVVTGPHALGNDELTLTFDLLRPWKYDASVTSTTGIGSTAVEVDPGTAPTRDVVLTVNGPTTTSDWNIVYENSTGGTLKTLGFSTLTLSSTQSVTVNMQDVTIVDESSNSLQAARDANTNFPWAIDPRDGARWNNQNPRLRVTSGSMNADVRKAWG